MSGSKRKSGYRKTVTRNYENNLLTLNEGDVIAQIISNKGSGIFEVKVSGIHGTTNAILPNKFKNLIWIKRNDFVVVDSIANDNYEIKQILSRDHLKMLISDGLWPDEFKGGIDESNVVSMNYDAMPEYVEPDFNDEGEEEVVDSRGNVI